MYQHYKHKNKQSLISPKLCHRLYNQHQLDTMHHNLQFAANGLSKKKFALLSGEDRDENGFAVSNIQSTDITKQLFYIQVKNNQAQAQHRQNLLPLVSQTNKRAKFT
eukprot:TRINITY_DN3523_c0_g2_i3.p3 TRINITY_DN3523_c0_g2~~TRINITY_DN3523_c0_g2_i3.p3  ORF type:complete len:107 (-),score=0.95 TRINITY_DN3523_c0_g2_i3:13-333(-)